MSRYLAPAGQSGINIGGAQFNADETGCITVPDGNYHDLLIPHGFVLQPDAQPVPPANEGPIVVPVFEARAAKEPEVAAEIDPHAAEES